jgi:hypothetical protein
MIKKLLLIHIAILTFGSSHAQKSEKKLIRNSFDNYKTSILNDKGDDAVKYVDSRTVNYYAEMLEMTKHADSSHLNSLGLMDKLMVFSIRHRATKEEILSFDGKGLLIYAIKEGMVGKNSVANNAIGDIEIDGTFAKGQLIANGQKAPFYFHFYKEEDIWKIDLTSLFPIASMAFKKMQQESGMSENQYLFMLLEMITGKKPGSEIWNKIE